MKTKTGLLTLLLLSVCCCLKAQDAETFNKIYTKTYLETSQKDFPEALRIADSLYRSSEAPLFQAKSLMLSATLYQHAADFKKAVQYAEQAKEIIEQTDDYNWQARIWGFLATQYRLLRLHSKSKNCSQKALEVIQKIDNAEVANSTGGLMLQELAYYEMSVQNYPKAIRYIDSSQQKFNRILQNREHLTTNNEQLLGLCYYNLQQYAASLSHYQTALELSKKLPENYLTGLIYNGLAQVYIAKDSLETARRYLDHADTIARQSAYKELKREVLKTSAAYYNKVKDIQRLAEIFRKKDTMDQEISLKATSFLNEKYTQLEVAVLGSTVKNNKKNIIIGLAGLLLFAGVLFFIYYRKRHKRQYARFQEILAQLEERESAKKATAPLEETASVADAAVYPENDTVQEQPPEAEKANARNNPSMTLETEQKLLAGLKDFERSESYIKDSPSLSSLAAHLKTNSKYLSRVINKHKKKDFNNYVNELRVNYIIAKLDKDPSLRKMKLSVLADLAGFSSHSKFAAVFKNVAGLSPSLFIQYLETNADKEKRHPSLKNGNRQQNKANPEETVQSDL